LLVPVGLVDEVLEALIGVLDPESWRQVDARDQRLDALAFAVPEVDQRPVGLSGQGEVEAEEFGVGLEPGQDAWRERGGESSVDPASKARPAVTVKLLLRSSIRAVQELFRIVREP
jgi:hypothetical protein